MNFIKSIPQSSFFRILYRLIALFLAVALWFGFMYGLASSLFAILIGYGVTTIGVVVFMVSFLPIEGVIAVFAYHGIQKRGVKLRDDVVRAWLKVTTKFSKEVDKN